jgi:hypothetical protein
MGPTAIDVRLTTERYLRFLEDLLPVLDDVTLHIGGGGGGVVAAIRRRTASFWMAGNCISQSTFTKPMDWAAVSGCLATEVTWPNSSQLIS